MRLPAPEPAGYARRKPEETDLHRIVARHLPAFLQRMEAQGGLPGFVTKTLEEYLTCGDLSHGFGRLHCPTCGDDLLVAFSCKRRGICPSCGGRRMADTAAHLVDRVLPAVPVRQWVLTVPFPLRRMMAFNAKLTSEVLGCLIAAVTRHYRTNAKRVGLSDPRTGSVTAIQRWGSALNVNPHFHCIFLDGVLHRPEPGGPLRFRSHPPLTDAAVAAVLADLERRVELLLRARGLLGDDATPDERQLDPHEQLELASVTGQPVLGPSPDKHRPPSSRGPGKVRHEPEVRPLCSEHEGFTLHAATHVARQKRGDLEVLLRYVLRPAIAIDRILLRDDGLVELRLPRPWSDGTTALTFTPMAFMARAAALIPAPYRNDFRYHGVLSPHAKDRAEVVASAPEAGGLAHDTDGHHPTKLPSSCPRERRLAWAELLKRTFAVDVLRCARCGGKRTLLAFVRDPASIRAILAHLGLLDIQPSRPRGPPQGELDLS